MKRNRFTSFVLSLAMTLSMTTMLNANISANAYTNNSGIIYGDANSDGEVNVIDLVRVKQYVLGMVDDDALDTDSADCFTDGTIDVRDAMRIKKYILQMIDWVHIDGSNAQELDGTITFTIPSIILSLDELQSCDKDDDGNYIIPVPIYVENNADFNVDVLQLSFYSPLGLYERYNGYSHVGANDDTYDTNAMDVSVATKKLIYLDANGKKEENGTAFTLYFTVSTEIESTAKDRGCACVIMFDDSSDNVCFDSDGNYIIPKLVNGAVSINVNNIKEPTVTTTVTTTDTKETTATTEDYSKYTFDVNHDGVENVVDLIILKKRLLGMI